MPLGDPGGYARGQGGGAMAGGMRGRLGGANPQRNWAQGMAARPMNAGPQNMMGGRPVNVAQRFSPKGNFNRRVSPPFQKFQGGWGPRTKGFQVPGRPNRDLFANRMPMKGPAQRNPNVGQAFAALPRK